MKGNGSIDEVLKELSIKARESLGVLSVSNILHDSLAVSLLTSMKLANGNAISIVEELRSLPIWHERTRNTWVFDDDVREHCINKLNGTGKEVRYETLSILRKQREELEKLPAWDMKDYDLQIARLSLTLVDEQQTGIASLRSAFDMATRFNNSETERVIDLYLDEGLSKDDQTSDSLPEYILSAFFMRGMYSYKKKDYSKALHFMEAVWKKRCNSNQSLSDAAKAAYIVGQMLSKDDDRWNEAEDAYKDSLKLNIEINNQFGQLLVYHSLGNLLSHDPLRSNEAEEHLRTSLKISQEIKSLYSEARVRHSLEDFLQDKSPEEAEEHLRTSLKIIQKTKALYDEARVRHSLGIFLIDKSPEEAGELISDNIKYYQEIHDNEGLKFSITAFKYLIQNLLNKEQPLIALANYRTCLRINPNTFAIEKGHIQLLMKIERYTDALIHIDNLIEKNPNNPIAHNMRANILKLMGKGYYKDAEKEYRQAIKCAENLDDLLRSMLRNNLALLLSEITGRHDEAISLWNEAINVYSNFVWNYVSLGKFYYHVKKDIESASKFLIQGLTKAKETDTREAIDKIIEELYLIKKEDSNTIIDKTIADYEFKKFSIKEKNLRDKIESIASYENNDNKIKAALYRDRLAILLSKFTVPDRSRDAIKLWEDAIKIYPDDPFIWIHLGEYLFVKFNDIEGAINMLLTGLAISERLNLLHAVDKAKAVLLQIYRPVRLEK